MAKSKKFGGILGSSTAGSATVSGITSAALPNPFTVEQIFTFPSTDNVNLINSLFYHRPSGHLFGCTYTDPCLLIRWTQPLTDLSKYTIYNIRSLLAGNGNLGVFGLDIGTATGQQNTEVQILTDSSTTTGTNAITLIRFNLNGTASVGCNSTPDPTLFGSLAFRGLGAPYAYMCNQSISSPGTSLVRRSSIFNVFDPPDVPTIFIAGGFAPIPRNGGVALQEYYSSTQSQNFFGNLWIIGGGNQPASPPTPGNPKGTPAVAWICSIADGNAVSGTDILYAQQVDLPSGDTLIGRRIAVMADKIFVSLQHGQFGTGDILVYKLTDITQSPTRITGASSANGCYSANGYVWVPTEADAPGSFGATLYRIDPNTLAVSALVLPTVGGGEHLYCFDATNGAGCANIQVDGFHGTGQPPFFAAYKQLSPTSTIVRFH